MQKNDFFRFLRTFLLGGTIILVPVFLPAQAAPDYRVFDTYQSGPDQWMAYRWLDQAWYHEIRRLAGRRLDERIAAVTKCTDRACLEERREKVKRALLESIGGLPARTTLNARVTERLERPAFTVEKIVYESLPGFYVTACLFLPRQRQQPAPAVIYCSGHTEEGFRSPTYQHVMLNLVKKGFIVLAFDPLGQGERYQYLDEEGRPAKGGPTAEHSYAGLPCLLNGMTVARYMIHDGMRAVDYLLSRPEVDAARIGITGRSGGGTQSAYIAAVDERIYAAAPENYLTSFRRLLASIGPQDAEQNLPGFLRRGLDHADLLAVRAPKPALMLTTTRDFFSIQGARETYAELQQVYRVYQADDRLYYHEDDYGHGSTKANREALYAFFQRHLEAPGDSTDREVEVFSPEALTITRTGQVGTALDSRTVFDLNEAAAPPSRETDLQGTALQELAGMEAEVSSFRAVFTGCYRQDEYTVEKYFLEFDRGRYPLPFLWLTPAEPSSAAVVLYLDSRGKAAAMAPGGPIDSLLRAGHRVLAPDLLHIGELGGAPYGGDSRFDGVSFNLLLGSSLIGKSLPTFQADDIRALRRYIDERLGGHPAEVKAWAHGPLCVSLLHAAAVGAAFGAIELHDPLVAWRDLLTTSRYDPRLAYAVVPGALPFYDLPELAAQLVPTRLTIVRPRHADGRTLTALEAETAYQPLRRRYAGAGAAERLVIFTEEP